MKRLKSQAAQIRVIALHEKQDDDQPQVKAPAIAALDDAVFVPTPRSPAPSMGVESR